MTSSLPTMWGFEGYFCNGCLLRMLEREGFTVDSASPRKLESSGIHLQMIIFFPCHSLVVGAVASSVPSKKQLG